MVVGLNHRTASLAMRERFWISDNSRYEILRQLRKADGIEEAVVLSTCSRTEFIIWASEPTIAANSLLRFLTTQYGLRLSEWEHFCRRLDEAALSYVFQITAGLDCTTLCEQQVTSQVKAAWQQARAIGTCGCYLNALLEKAISVAEKVAQQTRIRDFEVSLPVAALDLAGRIFGSLEGRKVLFLGAGDISEHATRLMRERGAQPLIVIDQSPARAQELAEQLGGIAATLADRWKYMLQADVVICSTGCPHLILTREEAERIASERNRVALVIIDVGMPRDVDPDVRRVDGILLYDMDGLERTVHHDMTGRAAALAEAEKIVSLEAQAFRTELKALSQVPTVIALRRSLEEICRQELESFVIERGPFTREQDQLLHAITAQVIHKIASSLTRELKEIPEKGEQEQMTAAVHRLFHLDSPQPADAGTKLENEQNDRRKQQAVANY